MTQRDMFYDTVSHVPWHSRRCPMTQHDMFHDTAWYVLWHSVICSMTRHDMFYGLTSSPGINVVVDDSQMPQVLVIFDSVTLCQPMLSSIFFWQLGKLFWCENLPRTIRPNLENTESQFRASLSRINVLCVLSKLNLRT